MQALRVDGCEREQRQAADGVVPDAIVDQVEHAGHDRDVHAELLAAWDQAADTGVGDRGEGDDQIAHAGPRHRGLEAVDRAEHGPLAATTLRPPPRAPVPYTDCPTR